VVKLVLLAVFTQVTKQTWRLTTRNSQLFTAEVAADFVTRHFCKTFPHLHP